MKRLLTLIVIIIMTVLPALNVQAAGSDYTIIDAYMDDSRAEEGKIYGYWGAADYKTNYSVRLYKGTKLILSKQVSEPRIDFSKAIASKSGGTGTYYFSVMSTKGGEETKIYSDSIEITSATANTVKKKVNEERRQEIAATGGGWTKGPGDIWIFYGSDGNMVKGKWLDYNGHKYYLDKNGNMQTGWQLINKAYYYLEPKGTAEYPMGACWVNTTTPDGYQVDENGARLNSQGAVETPKTIKTLGTVSVSLKEDQIPGEFTKISAITCGVGTISDLVYLSDPETWTDNNPGAVTFTITLKEGNILKVNSTVTCSRASSVTVLSRTSNTLSVELHYIPKYVLDPPDNIYITEDYALHWNKVKKASGYTVKIVVSQQVDTGDDSDEKKTKKITSTYTTEKPAFSLSDHDIDETTDVVSISIYANGNNKKLYIDSKAAVIDDLTSLWQTRKVTGEFNDTSEGLYYIGEDGERVKGWQEIAGDWYYFRNTGYAAGPGWFQDPKDSNWYYFDENHHMMTGTVVLEDGVYFLNDGTYPDYPLGAWIK